MKGLAFAVVLALGVLAVGQAGKLGPSTGRGTALNQAEAGWHHSASEPQGVENVALHEDTATGSLDVFARYPGGYTIPPHWHSSNERILLTEGRLQVEINGKQKTLDPGGFAFLPARELQRISCVSKTRCVMYMSWDSTFDLHKIAGQ
jgi:quercetin dioxygenase-like cupin family protein